MAAITPRFLCADQNYVKAAATVLSASSAQQANPVRYLLDQLRSKLWRSEVGWTVIAGWNDQILWVETEPPGVLTATLTAGYYATATEYAAAVEAALMAAPGRTFTYTVTYDAGTHKFTITVSSALTDLYFSASAGGTRRVGLDLGFTETNKGSSTTYTAENASYQGRQYIACDFGSALDHKVAVLLADNVSASGSVKAQFSATSILDALTDPDATETLTDQGDYWAKYLSATRTYRYAVLLISDASNTAGYTEAGIAYLGDYRQPGASYAGDGFAEEGDDLSIVERATEGANLGDLRTEARAWTLAWDDLANSGSDPALFRAIRTATPKGKDFFFDFDPATAGQLVYGYRDAPLPMPITNRAFWSPSLVFREALP